MVSIVRLYYFGIAETKIIWDCLRVTSQGTLFTRDSASTGNWGRKISSVVHHMLFHLCEYFDEKDGVKSIPEIYAQPGQCTHGPPSPVGYPGCTLLYAWARGGRPLDLPAEAGFRVRSTSKSKYYFVMDMHYNNPQNVRLKVQAENPLITVTYLDWRCYWF
jgi:hypothetical protein